MVVRGIAQLVTATGRGPAAGPAQGRVAAIRDAYLVVEAGRVVAVGPAATYDPAWERGGDARVLDLGGAWVTPGLVDPLAGTLPGPASPAGPGEGRGGPGPSRDHRVEWARSLLRGRLEAGVTACGLAAGCVGDPEADREGLEAIAIAAAGVPVRAVPVLAVPAAPPGGADGLRRLTGEVLPRLARAGLVRQVQVRVDAVGLPAAEARTVLEGSRALGLGARVEADRRAPAGGAALAAAAGAVAALGLEQASPDGLAALAAAGAVAVLLLPAAAPAPDRLRALARELIDRWRVPVALAAGGDPPADPGRLLERACRELGLSPAEALVAMTRNAARALGLDRRLGSLQPGKDADFVVWDGPWHGWPGTPGPAVRAVYRRGRPVWTADAARRERSAGEGGPFPTPLVRFVHLFNAGRYFESHELLEDAWRATGSDLYQGLILLAAAYVKRDRGNLRGLLRNLEKALAYLDRCPARYLGIHVAGLRRRVRRLRDRLAAAPPGAVELPRRVPAPRLALDPRHLRGDEPERGAAG